MKMRTWNYITLDQISTKVTSFGSKDVAALTKRTRSRLRAVSSALVVSTALLASANASTRLQPLAGTNPVTNIPIEAVESSAKKEPAFLEHFGKLFDRDFLQAHSAVLEKIAHAGTSLDAIVDGENVAAALRDSDMQAGWQKMA